MSPTSARGSTIRTPNEYLDRAEEAEVRADGAADEHARAQLRQVAALWRELARQAELQSYRLD
jgi:hypothetical protein